MSETSTAPVDEPDLTVEQAESRTRDLLDQARQAAAAAARLRSLQPQRRAPHIRKRSLAIDFDGVVHAYRKGWHDGTAYDEPMEGAIEGLRVLMELHPVYIFSTRNAQDIIAWFYQHAPMLQVQLIPDTTRGWETMGVLGVTNRKLPAAVIVDDRAVRFTNWRDIVNLLG